VITSPNPSVRWRLAPEGTVERSTTAGTSWVAAFVTPPAILTAGSSPDAQACWLVGRAGAVRLATDGVQFRAVAFPEVVDLIAVRATSARNAEVTAADGRVFRTGDQGATWSIVAR
jgi:photosystem II stability/assembly factor-like uncharacterized protein